MSNKHKKMELLLYVYFQSVTHNHRWMTELHLKFDWLIDSNQSVISLCFVDTSGERELNKAALVVFTAAVSSKLYMNVIYRHDNNSQRKCLWKFLVCFESNIYYNLFYIIVICIDIEHLVYYGAMEVYSNKLCDVTAGIALVIQTERLCEICIN